MKGTLFINGLKLTTGTPKRCKLCARDNFGFYSMGLNFKNRSLHSGTLPVIMLVFLDCDSNHSARVNCLNEKFGQNSRQRK